MNLEKVVIEALLDGFASRDKDGNVSVKIGGAELLVGVTDKQIEVYETEAASEAERAADEITQSKLIIESASALIEKFEKRKTKSKKSDS